MAQAGSPVALPPGRRRSPRYGRAAARDEHDRYPVHEEDSLPETPVHERIARYLRNALGAHLAEKWVTGDVCMYWERGNTQLYAAPDVLVVSGPAPDPVTPVYLRWRDAPPLLVADVGLRSPLVQDEGPKLATYGWHLSVPEYLYYHPDRRELHLYRLTEGVYRDALPDAHGRVRSEVLDVWFGVDDAGELRVYTSAGDVLLTHEESEQARREAEQARREAEQARRDAEARAQREAEARADLEQRLAQMEETLRREREHRGDKAG